MRIAVISPHLDDAVFSVGEHMLSRPDDEFTIVCPCGVVPTTDEDYEKYQILLDEHDAVCERMGWKQVNGPFWDDAAVEHSVAADPEGTPGGIGCDDEVGMTDFLFGALRNIDEVWCPVGIFHPDHLAVAKACRRLWAMAQNHGPRWAWFWELPYRVRWPADAIHAVNWVAAGAPIGFGPLGEQLEAKRRLCHLYASQIGPDIERHLYADERLWR